MGKDELSQLDWREAQIGNARCAGEGEPTPPVTFAQNLLSIGVRGGPNVRGLLNSLESDVYN